MFILLSGWTFFAIAQPANNSPYARYGLGNLNTGVNVRSAGVGGISIAMREDSIPYLVNFINPASYTSIGFTAFDIGVYGNIASISTATQKQNVNKANLSYFAFGFPILRIKVRNKVDSLAQIDEETGFVKVNKRILWGGAFGLREFSSVNYSATETLVDQSGLFGGDSSFNYSYLFQGDGGVNQFFIGLGLEPVKNLSIGMNASYLFGRLNRIQRLEFDESNHFNVKKEQYTDVGGFYVDYGLQYSLVLKQDTIIRKKRNKFSSNQNVLIFGATFAHPMQVRANSTLLAQTYRLSVYNEDVFRDTVAYNVIKGGHVTMPWKYGVGVTWKNGENWLLGVEHSQELWSTYKDVNGKNDSLADAWNTRIGLEYKPMVPATSRGFWAYFGKMHYRIGGYYGMTQYKVRGTQLANYGITLGFGFPMSRTRAGSGKYVQSMINFAVEWGQRGTTKGSLLLEDYWNFKLGFTLNDRWFIKRKYD
ncbi:MAG: hypothetical protein H6601_00100 [Flavobacteriales bacterium]|nr:hypothetical protein [Flavobacteriales bacterium]